jgi:hypothetical protein
MAKVDLKKSAMLAIPVTIAVWLVSFVFSKLNLGEVKELFVSIPATSVVTATTGGKVLSFISGYLPIQFNIPTILMVFVSAMIAILIGTFFVGQFKLPVFKSFFGINGNAGKIATILMYGAIPVYLVLIGFKIPSLMTVIGILVHTALVAVVTVYGAKLLNFKID